eukprot:6462666-Prymnesium_polylepis.1
MRRHAQQDVVATAARILEIRILLGALDGGQSNDERPGVPFIRKLVLDGEVVTIATREGHPAELQDGGPPIQREGVAGWHTSGLQPALPSDAAPDREARAGLHAERDRDGCLPRQHVDRAHVDPKRRLIGRHCLAEARRGEDERDLYWDPLS